MIWYCDYRAKCDYQGTHETGRKVCTLYTDKAEQNTCLDKGETVEKNSSKINGK